MDPYSLKKIGFKIRKIYQREGEIVITFPKSYHQGFNMGRNINEAFNVGSLNWLLQMLDFKNCEC